jgi:virginiamycin B lyase
MSRGDAPAARAMSHGRSGPRRPRRGASTRHVGAARALPLALLVAVLGLLALPAAAGAVVFGEVADPTPGAAPTALAAADDGVLWFTDPGSGRIGRVSPGNAIQGFEARPPGTPTGGPAAALTPARIAVGPDGALWYTVQEGGIARMTTTGDVTRYALQTAGRTAGIAAGPDGAMWFTMPDADLVGRITAPTDDEVAGGATRGQATTFALPAGSAPDDVVLGADSALWFTEPGTNAIGRVVPAPRAPAITHAPLPTAGGAPSRLTVGPDERIWFSAPGTHRLGRIDAAGGVVELPLPGTVGTPGDVAAAPDGALWFVDAGGGRDALGRITPAGEVTRAELPDPQGALGDLVRGADGDLRYTRAGARIGRADTLVSAAAQPPPPPVVPEALLPEAGRSVILEVVSGTVRVRRPGARAYEALGSGGAALPDGTEVDATNGRVRLTAETAPGSGITRTAVFWAGRFVVRQARVAGAATELRLVGRLACPAPATVRAKKARKKKPKTGRQLWGDGDGDFRTRGSRATASVRGTRWLVQDRCDRTTRVRVFVGVVSVRDRVRNRRVTLRTGEQYVAPGPRRRP